MDSDNLNNKKDEDALRDENMFLKMKMMTERGAHFSEPQSGDNLPPEIENQFLKNMEEFEKQFHSAKRIAIHDLLKNPVFEKKENLPDDKISEELSSVMKLLNDNGISLDTICEVDDRELYRFITEELIHHEVDDVKIPGMMSCFIYEEFYPNQEHDIKNDCQNFFYFFLQKEYQFYAHHLTDNLKNDSYLKLFSDSFCSFDLNSFEVTSLQIDGEKALVHYSADFLGSIEGTHQKQHFFGQGEMELKLKGEYWYIDKVVLPEKKDGI